MECSAPLCCRQTGWERCVQTVCQLWHWPCSSPLNRNAHHHHHNDDDDDDGGGLESACSSATIQNDRERATERSVLRTACGGADTLRCEVSHQIAVSDMRVCLSSR